MILSNLCSRIIFLKLLFIEIQMILSFQFVDLENIHPASFGVCEIFFFSIKFSFLFLLPNSDHARVKALNSQNLTRYLFIYLFIVQILTLGVERNQPILSLGFRANIPTTKTKKGKHSDHQLVLKNVECDERYQIDHAD